MSTSTPIKGWTIPLLDDSDPEVADLTDWVTSADLVMFPRFDTFTERDAAMASPDTGRVCFVAESGEYYKYKSGEWISLFPRRFVLDSAVTLADTTATPIFDFFLEGMSTYVILGQVVFTIPGDGLQLSITFNDTILEGRISIGVDTGNTNNVTGVTVTASSSDERLERIRGCYIVTNESTTAFFNVAKAADAGADGTIHLGTYIDVYKINGFGGSYGYPGI